MSISRLFEMVYLLQEQGTMTAAKLAEHFEVSSRTIYRDVEALSQAGIPIYASRGSGGGISLSEQFVLRRTLLSQQEQTEILSALRGMNALKLPQVQGVLTKLGALFGQAPRRDSDWISIDFSAWDPTSVVGERFQLIKTAILEGRVLAFGYHSSRGESTRRRVMPVQLLYKSMDWYVWAYCLLRREYRCFKLSRMQEPALTQERFLPVDLPDGLKEPHDSGKAARFEYGGPMIRVRAVFSPQCAYRVCEEFPPQQLQRQPDGSFLAEFERSEDEWLYDYLLSYGEKVEILSPSSLRRELNRRHCLAIQRNSPE